MISLLAHVLLAQVLMFGAWLWYRKTQKEVIADIGWALGIGLQGIFYYAEFAESNILFFLLLLLIIWSLRLSLFLWWNRLRQTWHDKRYAKIIERSFQSAEKTLLINYQIQGVLQWLVGLCWFFSMQNQELSLSRFALVSFLFVLGLGVEVIADEQLKQFKQHPDGLVCQRGLWFYSRHPNYCGELIIWFGFALASPSLLGMISPMVLYVIMRFITGPLTEETSIAHRGEAYLQYQKSTPMIWPYKWFLSKLSK